MSLKTALENSLDATALQMDCRDKLILAIEDIKKSLLTSRDVNVEIEKQMKLWRRRNEKCKV